MWSVTLVLIAATTLMACALLGGVLYEFLVVDPYWPRRPGRCAALRYSPSVRRVIGQHISFHHCYRPIEIGQHPSGQQPAHSGSENHRMLTDLRH